MLAVILLAVFLIMGGVLGLSRCSGPGHHRAVAVAPRPSLPAALIGGGGVTPRPVSGNLSAPGSVGEVLFAEAGIAIDANARRVIDVAGQNIRDRNAAVVTVTGYTDAIGSAPANRALSLRRVRAVIKILRQDLTGAPGPIQYRPVARGQGRPVAPNSTAAGRQLNRRVVITIG